MLNLNLEYFRAFYYVSKLGNMSKAAEVLYLSQPAISRSIKKLEEYFGYELFVRTSKGITLTYEGGLLFERISLAFEHLFLAERELMESQESIGGLINIAATETPLYHLLIPKIESFKAIYPKATIHVSGSSSGETIRLLREGLVSMTLAVTPVPLAADLDVVEMSSFHDILVAGLGYSELKNRVMPVKELMEYPIITVEKGTSARVYVDLWFEEQGVILEPAYTVRTSTSVLPFVRHNLGIGILPSMFAEEPLEQNKVFQVETEIPFPQRSIIIISLKNKPLSALCRNFLNHLRE